jgi:hypothetical protein
MLLRTGADKGRTGDGGPGAPGRWRISDRRRLGRAGITTRNSLAYYLHFDPRVRHIVAQPFLLRAAVDQRRASTFGLPANDRHGFSHHGCKAFGLVDVRAGFSFPKVCISLTVEGDRFARQMASRRAARSTNCSTSELRTPVGRFSLRKCIGLPVGLIGLNSLAVESVTRQSAGGHSARARPGGSRLTRT